ncbi:type II secretion system protein [Propionicicella superfundia]|uniref:type II secretion system protein n=1 Tax=Propionicicella superfundia TaxID=348582 RepID=UPI000404A741|nr:prepilin-type N-terminal cleavage/methylation domain-containing protein [Propionicicella superfundia]
MNALIRRYRDAVRRRSETDEQGFSLIELIVVVAILGILIAIAIPVFSGIQQKAQENSLKAVAANGANVVAGALAGGKSASEADLTSLVNTDVTAVTLENEDATLDDICVSATGFNDQKFFGGNGAEADGSACKA